jgi:hypothetical protein
MDLQKMIDSMNESQAKERGNYHLTYGGLIDALKNAPADAVFDKIKGIGSWRGSYIEIALFTESEGLTAEKKEFNDYGDNFQESYKKHQEENVVSVEKLPTNANELGELLESLLGLDFVGYKGGNFKIERYKPLWLCTEYGSSGNTAIIGIDEHINLITKEVD